MEASTMIDVIRVPLAKNKLKAMPAEERSLLILLGYAANQIVFFSKMITFSTNHTPENEAEQRISGAQSQMLGRYMIGILAETWELIRRDLFGTKTGSTLISILNPAGLAALDVLKKVTSSGILSKVRNTHVYHFPKQQEIDAAFNIAINDHEWDSEWNWYLSAYTLNSFYFTSDIVVLHSLLKAVGETNLAVGWGKVMAEVQETSKHMISFIYALSMTILVRQFGSELVGEIHSQITDAPSLCDVWIPFFVEVPEDDTSRPDVP